MNILSKGQWKARKLPLFQERNMLLPINAMSHDKASCGQAISVGGQEGVFLLIICTFVSYHCILLYEFGQAHLTDTESKSQVFWSGFLVAKVESHSGYLWLGNLVNMQGLEPEGN